MNQKLKIVKQNIKHTLFMGFRCSIDQTFVFLCIFTLITVIQNEY